MEQARDRDRPLDLEPEAQASPPTSVRRPCPVCRQVRVTKVCDPCGVDVDTGDLVQAPAPRLAPAAGARRAERDAAPGAGWTARDVLATARRAPFGTLVLAWLVFSLQLVPGTAAAIPALSAGILPDPGGPMALPARVMTLFLVAYALVGRTRGAVRGAHAWDLEELGAVMLRALLLLFVLGPALLHPLTGFAVAALLPLPLGALASERPLLDLAPASLARAAGRAPGDLARATLWSVAALGPALVALHHSTPLAAWRPVALLAGATLAGVAVGLARREAELRGAA